MNNNKAKRYLLALLIAIGSNSIYAATIKESTPIPTIKIIQLSHQDILTHMLMAEMALQRDMPEVALENYMLVAKFTKDSEVAQLATELAIQLQKPNEATAAADLWATSAPEDAQAQLVAVTLFVNSDQTKTIQFLDNAFKTKESDIDQHLLIIISKLSTKGQNNLAAAMNKLADNNKTNPFIQLAAAQLEAVLLNIPGANSKLSLVLAMRPELTSAIELKAKLIRYEKSDDKPALAYLEQQVKKYPKNSDLRMFYVTALTDNEMITQAIPQLENLIKDPVYGGDAYLMLGEIYIVQNKYPAAAESIKKAIKFENTANKANYYLGQLAEYGNKNAEAITWYEQVSEESEYHIPAFLRAAYLYSVSGQYTKALDTLQSSSPSSFSDQKQVLLTEVDVLIDSGDYQQALDNTNHALEVISEDTDFLYARSVVYGLMNKHTDAEQDLRKILSLEPNNANALNALGFTLSNQPARIAEAMPLLEKAISLNPDNPAYMDSMGWLLYKMGNLPEATTMLTKAYKLSGDNEIAAHLGEVLWVSGKQKDAKNIWMQALDSSPADQHAIQETLKRFNIPLTEVKTAPMSPTPKAKSAQ